MVRLFSFLSRKNIAPIIIIALCVAFAYTALVGRSAYVEAELQLQRAKRVKNEIATSLWRYGTVESVDAARGVLLLSMESRFYPNADYVRVVIQLDNETIIAKQELIRASGVATGLTTPEPSSIDALTPGTNVALLLENDSELQRIKAKVVLFGSPL